MTTDNFVTELLTLYQNKSKGAESQTKFNKFVEELSYDEMEKVIRDRITNSDGIRIINALFQGLGQSNFSQKKRVKIIELLLSEIFVKDIIPRDVSAILTAMVFEVDKLSHTHLLRISDLSVEYIGKAEDAQKASCWQELLPKILSVVVGLNELNHYGTDMSGEEYKQQVITSICQAKWNPRILAPIAAMFVHIPLNKEQHGKIIAKLCHSVEELCPEELPPFVHQLLQLAKTQNALFVFFALKKYFNRHIYHVNDSTSMLDSGSDQNAQRVVDPPASPLSNDLFAEGGNGVEVTQKGLEESEAMVLYHVEEVVKRSFCTGELIKAAKGCISCAEMMVDPFFLSVFLIISSVQSYEVQVLEILKNMITRLVEEEEKRVQSDWLQKVLNTRCNVEIVIQKLIKSKACEHEAVLKGLLSLSMTLLKSNSKTVARYGRIIATNLALKHNIITGGLLDTLVTHIISSPEVIQYIECMDELCDAAPYLVNNYPQIITRLLEILPSLPEIAAAKVIYAMVSLIKTSPKMRDNLILILRKSLFVHNATTRKLAVSGFLQLLKRLKIKGMQSLSQNSFQAYTCPSVFTQTIMDLHSQSASSTVSSGYNEGLCLEIIQLLKRCFSLQAPIKIAFYSELPKALTKNPDLSIPIVDVFLSHLANYYEPSDDKLPPLNFSKIVSIVKDAFVLQEPIGHLIFVIYEIISTHSMTSVEDDAYNSNVIKLENIMNSLVSRFIKLQPRHLGLDDDHDTTTEESAKEETVRQCLNVYHSLIIYTLSTWTDSTTLEESKTVVSLFKAYSHFEEEAKTSKSTKKPGGAAGKKTQETNTTQAASVSGPGRKPQVSSEICLDLKSINRLLTLVLGVSTDWCSNEVAEEVGKRSPFRRYCLTLCLLILNKEKSRLSIHRSKTTMVDLYTIGRVIYQRCVSRFEEAMEFDEQSAILALDVFNEICSITFSIFKRQTAEVLMNITEMHDSSLDDLLKSILCRYQSALLFVLQANENNDDLNFKRSVASILKGIQCLTVEFPITGSGVQEAYSWLRDVAVTKSLPSPSNVKILINLLFTLMTRCKSDSSLHDNIAVQLCGLFGSINDDAVDEPTVKLAVLNDSTKDLVYPILCTALISRLDAVDWTVSRAKAELALINQPDATSTAPVDRSALLKRKEMELVTELSLVVSAARWLTMASIPLDCAEIACRLLHHIYTSLVGFTKYFMGRGSPAYQEARFGKLVKSAASHLSSQMSQFLLYIESADIDERDDNKKMSVKVRRRAKKQISYIPKVVAELENFTKCVTQLGIKYKDSSLDSNMKLTIVRDFRINLKKIEEAMKRGRESDDDDVEVGNVTVALPTTSTQESNQSTDKKRKRTTKKAKPALKHRKTT